LIIDRDVVSQFVIDRAGRAAEGGREIARSYLGVLFLPARHIPQVAAETGWAFPLVMVVGWGIETALVARLAWPTLAQTIGMSEALASSRPNMPAIFAATLVFAFALGLAAMAAIGLFTRQRADLRTAMNCVAAAAVPLSALTVVAWLVLYLSLAFAALALLFGALAAAACLTEALGSQYDLPPGRRLYVIPLVVIAALVVTGVFLLVLGRA
jgi:hypothetical protein